MPATPEDLLATLAESPSYPYPETLIAEMIQRREEMIPALLAVVEDVVERPDHYFDDANWKSLTFAAYLLAQFRETRAFKPLCATLRLPAEVTSDLWGETLCDDMGRILASVYDGDDTPLRDLMANPEVHEFVRGAAVSKAYQCLLQSEQITLAELEAYTEELLTVGLEREPGYAWDSWAILCGEHGFVRLMPLVEKAFDEGLCNPQVCSLDHFVSDAENGGTNHWIKGARLIDDTVKETEWWYCWKKPEEPTPAIAQQYVEPRSGPKIGRNDPCPCGSGKKYKKCCVNAA